MKAGGTGGSETKTGLLFEQRVDLLTLIGRIPGYTTEISQQTPGTDIFYRDQLVAKCLRKNTFYKYLEYRNVDWKSMVSALLLPDDALLVIVRETLFIIEIKFQKVPGSTDEKLQTCDFKRKQYQRLVAPLELKVEYVYVLNDWFRQPRYKDVLDYIHSVNCHYKFNELPLAWLGLPAS